MSPARRAVTIEWGRGAVLGLLVVGLFAGCSLGTGQSHPLRVPPFTSNQLPLSGQGPFFAFDIESEVRSALEAHPSLRISNTSEARYELRVQILRADVGLETFSDPGVRASVYRARVQLGGRLAVLQPCSWASFVVAAEAPAVSPPGGLEALEGTLRSALARAARSAARRLASRVSRAIERCSGS